jgi:endonuclease/exonuclease/phosphatase family metal-dependent hydrolase
VITAITADLAAPVIPETDDHDRARAEIEVLHQVEVAGDATASTHAELRIVAANLERGRLPEAWADLFRQTGGDVFLLSEVDGGMARTGNRYVARELAAQLGAEFAFVVEFVELTLGGEEEQAALPPDAVNEFGVHGGAVVSRVGLERPAGVRFENDGWWFGPDSPERRIGGRIAVLATVADVVVAAVHLESHGSPAGRAEQVGELLDVLEGYAEGRPVVVGGDLNTHTIDHTGGRLPDEPLPRERFRAPVGHEPLFAVAAERGYGWEAANRAEPTQRTASGRGDLNLDWFLTRGVQVSDPEIIPAVDGDGRALSDHEVIALTVRPA